MPKPQGGRPPFQPTEDQRRAVIVMVSLGIAQKRIALAVVNPATGAPIDGKTLRAHFSQEIRHGADMANTAVAANLFKIATSDMPQAFNAARYWLACRAGWKETQVVETPDIGGVMVAPATMTPEEWVAAQDEKNRQREAPSAASGEGKESE